MIDRPMFWSTVWEKLSTWGKWVAQKLLAPGVALIIVVVAVVLVAMGAKDLQIGGLLARLLGKKAEGDGKIDIANTVDPDRVDKNGKLIPPGTPDSQGSTQAVVVPIENSGGLFSNPDTVKFTPPGEDKPREIKLPDGVTAKDVDKVIVVQPEKFVVTVKDNSKVSGQDIDDLLKKYGN